VPEFPLPLLLPPPQASKPPVRAARKTTTPILVCQRRRLAGRPIPKNMAKARSIVPLARAAYPLTPGLTGYARTLVAAVVEMVSVAVPALPLVMLTGLDEPKLNVGKS
jgi:hypothetical protein